MIKKKLYPIGVFISLVLGMLIFPYIPLGLFNIPYENFSLILKVLYMFFCDIGFMVILFFLYRKKLINDFKLFFGNFRENFERAFKYYAIGVVLMIVSNLTIVALFNDAVAGNEEAVRDMIDQVPLYMLFSVSIYAPFVEELIFRNSIKNCFNIYKQNKIIKYLFGFTSGFIFAFLHIIGQTNSIVDYLYIIPYMSLGVVFALLYYDTDNIYSSILMHMFHNTITIILYFMAGGIV